MTAEAAPKTKQTTEYEAAPKTKQTTEYVVLVERSDPQARTNPESTPEGWHTIVAIVSATSASDAIRQAVDGASKKEGTYRAIPKRSWKPVKVTVKTETRITLG